VENSKPLDIQKEWLSVIRRLQSVAKSEGLQVITISILVDEEGTPKAWAEPRKTKIEPKNAASALLSMIDAYNQKL
jgi:hypothetical protein